MIKNNQGISLFVYDNSMESHPVCCENITYIHDPQNSGLSVAYNTAARYAKENGYEWMLLLDQDTDFSNILIDDYINAIESHPEIKMFAPKVRCGKKYMSPTKVWHRMGFLQDNVPIGIVTLSKYCIINSGMCVNVNAMIECGGYKEDVFLDYSDYQFIERFRIFNSNVFVIDKVIEQSFSVKLDNKDNTLNRFKLYCKSIKACDRNDFSDNFWYFVMVLKRGSSICLKYKTLSPIKTIFSNYF